MLNNRSDYLNGRRAINWAEFTDHNPYSKLSNACMYAVLWNYLHRKRGSNPLKMWKALLNGVNLDCLSLFNGPRGITTMRNYGKSRRHKILANEFTSLNHFSEFYWKIVIVSCNSQKIMTKIPTKESRSEASCVMSFLFEFVMFKLIGMLVNIHWF